MITRKSKFQWFPFLLILWNLFDIAVHVGLNMAEPYRIAGNAIGIAAALIIWFGLVKAYAPHVVSGAAVLVIVLNVIHSVLHGWLIPSCLLYTSPSPRDVEESRMPSSA